MPRKENMQNKKVVFVCEHGAAKSVVAAAHFNRLASEMGLSIRAIARGKSPDAELSPKAVEGLKRDGLTPTETVPQKISSSDVESAEQIVSFCELPEEYQGKTVIEQWDDVPPVSEDYEKARDVIVERLHRLMNEVT
jgi:protein-tyrosine-phosphatase